MNRFSKNEKSLVEESLQLSDMIEFAKHTENNNAPIEKRNVLFMNQVQEHLDFFFSNDF